MLCDWRDRSSKIRRYRIRIETRLKRVTSSEELSDEGESLHGLDLVTSRALASSFSASYDPIDGGFRPL